MTVIYLELRAPDDTETIQNWLDSHSTATIISVNISGFAVYIFYE